MTTERKTCTKCKKPRPLHFFAVKTTGRQDSWCRPCYATEARRRRKQPSELSQKAQQISERARRAKAAAYTLSFLKTHPCIACGEADPVVLDFDHIRGVKRYGVFYMVSHQWGLKSIQEEIDKCQVLCANCHRRKTAQQQNWYKLRGS
jgi:hypothetical protein